MQVVHVNFTEKSGGAARAAHRLHTGLRAAGTDSRMLVMKKVSNDPTVHPVQLNMIERLRRRGLIGMERPRPRLEHAHIPAVWTVGRVSSLPRRALDALRPDILHLHWVSAGMLSIQAIADLARRYPLVWTLHDMWALTGGCHFSGDCARYETGCGCCPALGSRIEGDQTRGTWEAKQQAWHDLPLHIITPSRWLAACARRSPLLRDARITVIPNGIDTARFRPFDRGFARDVLGLPQDRRLILFGAHDLNETRKGFGSLWGALRILADQGWAERAALVTFGGARTDKLDRLALPVHHLGSIDDDRVLALTYAAADVFAAPSSQDNLPNGVMEALACGVPCVAFNIGGLPDMIEHQRSGYLAAPGDVADLAAGLKWVLADEARWAALSAAARHKATVEYDLQQIAADHRALYQIMHENRGLNES